MAFSSQHYLFFVSQRELWLRITGTADFSRKLHGTADFYSSPDDPHLENKTLPGEHGQIHPSSLPSVAIIRNRPFSVHIFITVDGGEFLTCLTFQKESSNCAFPSFCKLSDLNLLL